MDERTHSLFPESESVRVSSSSGMVRYVDVAIPVPLRRRFTYRVPTGMHQTIVPGVRVAVPFGNRKLTGIVLADAVPAPGLDPAKIRDVASVIEVEPVLPLELLSFLREAADYYMHPIGEVLRVASPALTSDSVRKLKNEGFLEKTEKMKGKRVAIRKTWLVRHASGVETPKKLGQQQAHLLSIVRERGEILLEELRGLVPAAKTVVQKLAARGLVDIEEREVAPDPFFAPQTALEAPLRLNVEQEIATNKIVEALTEKTSRAFLLHGVTGSGKTEVYLHAIAKARALGRGAIVLVPEISLTPQLVSRFRARFGDEIAVIHSALTEKERYDSWRKLRAGELNLAIGARSALFAPVRNLGVIIVDEEHDPSFKQEEGFRYNGRDMALLRAHRADAVCILGSATPSMETYALMRKEKLVLLELKERATQNTLPEVEIVSLTQQSARVEKSGLLSVTLHRSIEKCLGNGAQAILFLNRRGFAPSVLCRACGTVAECPACSVSLTEHRGAGTLRCHYCDFATRTGDACTKCGALALDRVGIGTERLEEYLAQKFPTARVGRLDRDTATGRGVEEVIAKLRRREIDLLVGTQMVTKGHDLPGVTLVGVVLADQSLLFPDFRASERTFQLLAQVAGRAGRGEAAGRVIFQTYQPAHPAIVHAKNHDYVGFFDDELEARRELGYPPFARLVAIRIDAGDESRARATAEALAAVAMKRAEVTNRKVRVVGPAPAPIFRVRGRYRFRLMLRSPDRASLRAVTTAIVGRIDEGIAPARASVDIDPISML